MTLRFSLDTFLREHGLTAYRLVKETEGLVARGSVFAMARGESVKRVDLENLEHIMAALGALTGKTVQVGDLIAGSVEPAQVRRSAADVPYTDDEETNEVLNDHPDILERLSRYNDRKVPS
ncbi:helix-turn-helix transcriptional regulator [Deinococcus sp. YIM 134068]|uniref:helix-turn-helix domain-containing protein n=1 Tax=Deinococcus lichenicola TaxID=3118910 RepID=UPI002F9497FC